MRIGTSFHLSTTKDARFPERDGNRSAYIDSPVQRIVDWRRRCVFRVSE